MLGCIGQNEQKQKMDSKENSTKIPTSLDKYYQDGPSYLLNMFEFAGVFNGIIINLQQRDMINATNSFSTFSKLYRETSEMVPEWKGYFDPKLIDRLGKALGSGNSEEIYSAIDTIGMTCLKCHDDNKPYVVSKYYWKDFREINMMTTNLDEPELPFLVAKYKYLVIGFDGVIINAKENQQKEALDSWNQFNRMFANMESTCTNCHVEIPRYFVSQDVKDLINKAEQQIKDGNLTNVASTMRQIGTECYKCHIIHQSPQIIKRSLE